MLQSELFSCLPVLYFQSGARSVLDATKFWPNLGTGGSASVILFHPCFRRRSTAPSVLVRPDIPVSSASPAASASFSPSNGNFSRFQTRDIKREKDKLFINQIKTDCLTSLYRQEGSCFIIPICLWDASCVSGRVCVRARKSTYVSLQTKL